LERQSSELEERAVNNFHQLHDATSYAAQLITGAARQRHCAACGPGFNAGRSACTARMLSSSPTRRGLPAPLTRPTTTPSRWNGPTRNSVTGPQHCGGALSWFPDPWPCLSRIQRMRCRPDSPCPSRGTGGSTDGADSGSIGTAKGRQPIASDRREGAASRRERD
jgi:hypothetical protein